MNLTPLQSSFASGELSPLMRNRTEVDGHKTGVEIMENVIALSQGPAKNRDPLIFIEEFVGEALGRVETIQLSINRFVVAVFLNFEVQFFLSDGSPVVSGHADNPRFSQFGASWTAIQDNVASTVLFQRHLCTLSPRNNPGGFAGIRQTVTLDDGGVDHEFHVRSDVESSGDDLELRIGTALGLSDLLLVRVNVNDAAINFDPLGNVEIWIEVRNDSLGAVAQNNPVGLSAVDILDVGATGQTDITPYPATDLGLLQFIEAPAGDTIFIVHPLHAPHFMLFDDILGSVTFNPVDFDGTEPAEWGENNFPVTGVVDRGRMYYAGTPDEPEQIWASKVGDFNDMTTGITEEDGFSVVNSHFGAIVWMLSAGNLIFGSTTAEYLITSVGPIVFIGDVQINRQSAYGSVGIRAEQVADKVLYVTRDAHRLHAMQFDRDNQAWLSEEISFPSSHIMDTGSVSFAYEQYPHNLAWFGQLNGSLAACNYNRPMQIYGWHRHSTQGTIVDIATGDQGGASHLVTLSLRGPGNLLLEITNASGSPIDSRITKQLTPAGTVVTGLEHLEGESCQVVADGAVHPNRTVVGGQITLQLEAEFVQVGLGYRKRILTLPFDNGSQKGSARAYTKRYKDIYLALLDSAVPFINGQLPAIRTPQVPMNEAPPLTTGLVKVHNLGWDKEAPVDIIQDGPLALQVTGIYGEVVQDKV